MPMSGKNIFKSMTSTSTLETGKKLNTNWSEKKRNSKGKDRIIWNQNRKTKRKSMKPKTLLFDNINKIGKPLARLIRKKKKKNYWDQEWERGYYYKFCMY